MRRLGPALASAMCLVATAAGCHRSISCEQPERCNAFDDDCDGRVDEGFVSADGQYRNAAHCGSCGVDCRAVFPTAAEVACADRPEGPTCELIACPDGFHPSGDGACAEDVPVRCLPCTDDADCAARLPGARCLTLALGQRRCGQPCGACPASFACVDGQCRPENGSCACADLGPDATLACTLETGGAGSPRCAGVQRCLPSGLSECESWLDEACNGQDDDCDGRVDETFVNAAGIYRSRFHCGGCGIPCTPPGANATASCEVEAGAALCRWSCDAGFVDVDGIEANGCECERYEGSGAPPPVGSDADCDGVPDDNTQFIFVTTTGNDASPGSLVQPMRTIQAGLARGLEQGKSVLIAGGVYTSPVAMVGGVSFFGGYSPDFRNRNLSRYPVVLEAPGRADQPALRCRDITAPTRAEGLTIRGRDASDLGQGSTAVYLDGCGPAVELAAIEVFAGRGADGRDGRDSSDNLAGFGVGTLAELDGSDGAAGRPGTGDGVRCSRLPGGAGGAKRCRGADVSGGGGGDASCVETGCRQGAPCGNAGCTDFTSGGVCDLDAVLRAAVPNPPSSPGQGVAPGAAGVSTYNAPTSRNACNFCDDNPTLPRDSAFGGDGAPGRDGMGGVGCTTEWMVEAASGRLYGGSGTVGAAGSDGSGGGGGSAGAGYDVIRGTPAGCTDRAGGSGGGGGSGGCGAPGAGGGTGGGASLGVAIRLRPRGGVPAAADAGPQLIDVRIVTESGGRGGDGGRGADGGSGGIGAAGGVATFWCARSGGRGGDGGRGGAGGGGGGGCGGASYGVAVFADGPADAYLNALRAGARVEAVGIAGAGGRGGFSRGRPGTDGQDGASRPFAVLSR